jgi:hypothetical protein
MQGAAKIVQPPAPLAVKSDTGVVDEDGTELSAGSSRMSTDVTQERVTVDPHPRSKGRPRRATQFASCLTNRLKATGLIASVLGSVILRRYIGRRNDWRPGERSAGCM